MKKLVTAAAAALVLLLAAAAPAQAVFVRPSQAPLLNAAGEDSTCVLTTSGSTSVQNGKKMIDHTASVECERSWLRHRVWVSAFVVQDGERVLLYGPGGGLSVGAGDTFGSGSSGPICQRDAYGTPWNPQRGVTYQIVLVSTATVKDTASSSGVPWTARTEKLVEVTCWNRS